MRFGPFASFPALVLSLCVASQGFVVAQADQPVVIKSKPAPLPAQKGVVAPKVRKPQPPWWAGDIDEALAAAETRNVPLIVFFIQDGEEANDRVVEGLFPTAEFVKALEYSVPIIANISIHGLVEVEEKGKKRGVCKRFGGCSCDVHRRLELELRAEFWPDGSVKTPSAIVFRPDLSEAKRLIDVHPASAYARAIGAASREMGPGLSSAQHARGVELQRLAKEDLAAKLFGRMQRHLDELDRIRPGSPFSKTAAQMREAMLTKIERALGAIASAPSPREVITLVRILEGATAVLPKGELRKRAIAAEKALLASPVGKRAEVLVAKGSSAARQLEKADRAVERGRIRSAATAYVKALALAPASSAGFAAEDTLRERLADRTFRRELREKDLAGIEAALRVASARRLAVHDAAKARTELEQVIARYGKSAAAKTAKSALDKELD